MKTNRLKWSRLLVSVLFVSASNIISAADEAQTQAQDQIREQVQQQVQTQEQDRSMVTNQSRDRERIYGSQMMTAQERTEYRTKMRSMKTQKEREVYRLEHHKRMQERARERGMALPDNPPAMGKGMGPGGGRHGR